jgi:tRNA dimethylallyltransferase
VVGPTATGKTALGVAVAQALQAAGLGTVEIISADSRVIYQALNIGTAKPTLEEQGGIPHHLIDVAHPTEAYSAARYQQEATAVLEAIVARGHLPVVVGGTGFYLRALLQEEFIPSVPPNEGFREALIAWADTQPPGALHQRLAALDPVRAAALHPNDQVRLVRALEIIHHTGAPVPNAPQPRPHSVCWIGLTYGDRDLLRRKIDQRIEVMLAAGWLEEVADLLERYGPEAEALRVTHGYPELVQVVQGQRSLEDAIAQIQINIHQYARRQMTWFRRNPAIHWLTVDTQPWEPLSEQAIARAISFFAQ